MQYGSNISNRICNGRNGSNVLVAMRNAMVALYLVVLAL